MSETLETPPEGPPPDLSVVVPAVNGRDTVLAVLHNLHAQEQVGEVEVLLPERCGEEVRSAVRERFPGVRILPVEPGTPIPEMRRLAFEAARADSVAVIEDHVLVPPDWARRLLDARAEGHPVVGGWVRNAATDRLSDRAAFLCEYGHMLVPLPSGRADWLTGNNTVYARDLLERFREVIAEGRWEDRLHGAITEAGIPLERRTEVVADHDMRYRSAFEYAGQRYLYSRAYAEMRARGAGLARRLVLGLGTIVLPPLLLLRILRNAWARPDARGDAVLSLPYLLLFVSAWALGEAVGALAGAGDALGRVR